MTDIEKVNILVKEGEGLTVEFKEHFTPRIDEDIVAFSNTRGGVILLGVRDEQTVGGETLTSDMKARINSVARNCNPPIHVKIKQIQDVVLIEVPQGEEKPYGCGSGYFRRLAGVLFFAKDPRRLIIQAQMTLIAFKGLGCRCCQRWVNHASLVNRQAD